MDIFAFIRENVNLTDHISTLGVELDRSRKKFVCPFHNDSNPSGSISESKGIFKCFVCGVSGDVTKFHAEYTKKNQIEAAKDLNNIYNLGINFLENKMTEEELKEYEDVSNLTNLFQELLEDSLDERGMVFLKNKYGITNPKTMNLGYVPERLLSKIERKIEKSNLIVDEKTKKKFLLSTFIFSIDKNGNLVQKNFMQDCISFPFFNNSKITTFQFRLIEPTLGKVFFPPSEIVIDDEKIKCIFYDPEALFVPFVDRTIERKKYFVLVEGPGDSGSIASKGYNSGAFCTNNSSLEKLTRVKKIIDTRKLELIVWLDSDVIKFGEEYGVGMKQFLEKTVYNLSSLGIKHRVLMIETDGKEKIDPADFIIKNPDEDIDKLIEEKSVDGISFKIKSCKDCDEFIEFLSGTGYSETQTEYYIKQASKFFGVSSSSISRQIKKETYVENDFKLSESDKTRLKGRDILSKLEVMGYRFFKYKDVDGNEVLVMKSKQGKVHDITSSSITSKSASEDTKSLFYNIFGLNYVVPDHKAVLGAFSFIAYEEAFHITKTGFYIHNDTPPKDIERFNDIYVSFGEESKTIVHIKSDETDYAKKVEEIENPSSSSSVMLQPSRETRGFAYEHQEPEKLCKNSKIIYEKVVDSMSCSESDALMLLSWSMASIMNTKDTPTPIMWLKGGSGSGKTVAAKLIQSLITGKQDMSIESSMPSIFRTMKASPLFTIDNLESEDAESKKSIILASATTKMRSKAGKTTNATITEIIKANLMLTSIEPYGKEEVSNRTLEIKFDKVFRKKREPELSSDFLIRNRDKLASCWINLVAYSLSDKDYHKKINMYCSHISTEMKFIERASKFTAQTILILHTFLYFLYDMDESKASKKLREVLEEFSKNQISIKKESVSGAPIINLLETLKSELYKKMGYTEDLLRINGLSQQFNFTFCDDGSFHIEGSPTEVFSVCCRMYKDIGIRMPFSTSNVMSSRLKDIPPGSEWKFSSKRKSVGRFWVVDYSPDSED